jgi:hypothetical protein
MRTHSAQDTPSAISVLRFVQNSGVLHGRPQTNGLSIFSARLDHDEEFPGRLEGATADKVCLQSIDVVVHVARFTNTYACNQSLPNEVG